MLRKELFPSTISFRITKIMTCNDAVGEEMRMKKKKKR
jgi:hypothetical protein